jgi:hypothetical protein
MVSAVEGSDGRQQERQSQLFEDWRKMTEAEKLANQAAYPAALKLSNDRY